MTDKTQKQPETLTVKLNGEPKRLLMTFGIINQLITYIQSPLELIQLPTNPELQEVFLYEILSERDENGVIIKAFKTFDLSPEVATAVISWAAGHVNDFFIKTLSQQQDQFSQLIAMTTPSHGQSGSQA